MVCIWYFGRVYQDMQWYVFGILWEYISTCNGKYLAFCADISGYNGTPSRMSVQA